MYRTSFVYCWAIVDIAIFSFAPNSHTTCTWQGNPPHRLPGSTKLCNPHTASGVLRHYQFRLPVSATIFAAIQYMNCHCMRWQHRNDSHGDSNGKMKVQHASLTRCIYIFFLLLSMTLLVRDERPDWEPKIWLPISNQSLCVSLTIQHKEPAGSLLISRVEWFQEVLIPHMHFVASWKIICRRQNGTCRN